MLALNASETWPALLVVPLMPPLELLNAPPGPPLGAAKVTFTPATKLPN